MKRKERDTAFEERLATFEQLDQEADIGDGHSLLVYRMGHCTVIVGQTSWGWHLAISHPRRFPTWAEVMDARYHLVPQEISMALILPPDRAHLEVHPNTFQLWQVGKKEMRRLNA